MNRPEQDEALIQRSRAALTDSAEQLDYASQLKLQRARQAAVAALDPNSAGTSRPPWWQLKVLWLAAVPAALAVVVALPLLFTDPTATVPALTDSEALAGFDDMELLASEADLETLADMEFYQWLAEHPDASEA